MNQHNTVKRIEEICKEFDERVKVVGLLIARLELAKALAEAEPSQQGVESGLAKSCRFCDAEVWDKATGLCWYHQNNPPAV